MEIKVSVLVPIYNTEKYLEKCLGSLVSQTLKEMEIICINDGSTDGSGAIIRRFAGLDSRITVIDKENTGYGDSMNRGLDTARGEYIGILEADDFASKDMFFNLYEKAIQEDADVIKSNFYLYWESPERKEYYNGLKINEEQRGETTRKSLFHCNPAIWSALYKKSFLEKNNIRFLPTPGASYQDTSFNFKVACTAKKILLTRDAYLYYRQDNAASSVKCHTLAKAMLLHKEWDEAARFLTERGFADRYRTELWTEQLLGMYWNFGRLSSEDRETYYRSLYQELKKAGPDWNIDKSRMAGALKYGLIHFLKNGNYQKANAFYRLYRFFKP